MAGEWREVTVQDIAERTVSGPFGSNIKSAEYVDHGVPVIRGVNLAGPRFHSGDYVYISPEKADQLSSSTVFPGDIVFAARGSIGSIGIVPAGKFRRYILSSNMIALTVNRTLADPLYVFYYFRSKWGQAEIQTYVSTTGVPKIARALESLRKFRVILPPLPVQRAIAHILGTLDDKIELLRRMNETLEAMARALFKSWFMDFDPVIDNALEAGNPIPDELKEKAKRRLALGDKRKPLPEHIRRLFPDRFMDSELSPIPEGWRVGKVSDLGDIVCGKTPPTKDQSNFGDDVPFITIPDMHNKVFITQTSKRLSRKGADTQKTKYLPPYSVCVSCIATPGLVVLTSEESQTNQQINSVIPKGYSPFFSYELLSQLGNQIRVGGSGGSVFANLSKGRFADLNIVLPTLELVEIFHELVSPIFNRILRNEHEIAAIAAIRDALLPKLISSEIRVRDTERFLAEVGI